MRLCGLLKLPKQMQKFEGKWKTSAEGKRCLNTFSRNTHSLSTLLGTPQLCLPMLHLWKVAKTALRQENQTD